MAAVPLVFSVHQFCEGLVWVGLNHHDTNRVTSASVVYLFFALAFWPVWIPLSFLGIAPHPRVKLLLGALAVVGLSWAWLYYPIARESERWLMTRVVPHSIR